MDLATVVKNPNQAPVDLWNTLAQSKTAWDHCFKLWTDKTYYKLDKRFCNLSFEIHAPGNFVCGEGDRIKAQKKKICEASLQFLNLLQQENIKIIDAELKVDQCSLGIIQVLLSLLLV